MVKEFFCGLLFFCGVIAVLVPEAREPDSGSVVVDTLESRLIEDNTLTPKTIGQTATQIEQAVVASNLTQKAFDESLNELQSKIDDLEQRIDSLSAEGATEASKEIAQLSLKASSLMMTAAVGQAITEQLDTPNASDMTIWYEGEPYKDGDAIPDIIEVNTKREIAGSEVDTPQNYFDRKHTEALTDEKTYTSSEIYFARIIFMVIAGGAVWMLTRFILSAADGLISDSTQITVSKIVVTITAIGPLCYYFDDLWLFIVWALWLVGSLTINHITGARRLGSIRATPLDGLRTETDVGNSYRASGQSPSQVIETMRRSSLEPVSSRGASNAASSSKTQIRTTEAPQQSDADLNTNRMVTANEKQHRKINLD